MHLRFSFKLQKVINISTIEWKLETNVFVVDNSIGKICKFFVESYSTTCYADKLMSLYLTYLKYKILIIRLYNFFLVKSCFSVSVC